MSAPHPAVFDCNVYLQAILSPRGASHACWQHVRDGHVTLYVSEYILDEIRRLPLHRRLQRLNRLTPESVERFIVELLSHARLITNVPGSFTLPRDPDDAHYVNLAIATGAMLVVSNDKDLLDLMKPASAEGATLLASHPSFRILTPPQFLVEVERS